MTKTAILLTLLCLTATPGRSEIFGGAGMAGPQTAIATARSESLGGAWTGQADDATTAFFNPAGLGELKSAQVSIHHQTWLVDVFQENVVAGVPAGSLGGFGAVIHYVNYGVFDGRDDQGQKTRALGASDLGLGLSWGARMLGPVYFGLSARSLQETLADTVYQAMSGDAGLLLSLPRQNLRVGLSALNFGTSLGGSTQYGLWKGGVSWGFKPELDGDLLFCLGITSPVEGTPSLQVGAEVGYLSIFYLRGGMDRPLQRPENDIMREFAFGFGFKFSAFNLDYAYKPFSDLGSSQRLSVGYSLGQPSLPAAPVRVVARKPAATPVPTRVPTPIPDPPALEPMPTAAPQPTAVPVQPRPAQAADGLELYFGLPNEQITEGQRLLKEGKYREAIDYFNAALAKSPKNGTYWRGLGEAYLRLGNKDYARRCFEESLRQDPGDSGLLRWMKDNPR